jgi:hypothetical protein
MALYYSKGTISYMSEITSGTSTSGRDWARMTIMIDILGYKGSISKLSFQVGTDRISDVQEFKVGDKVEIGWSIYAREYNGRWYNNVDLVNIKSQEVQAAVPAPTPAPKSLNNIPAEELEPHEEDLPF